MGYSPAARRLRKPRLVELPRGEDRVSYLSLDKAAITQDRTGLHVALAANGDRPSGSAYLPAAGLRALMLGPGCSITTPALTTLHNAGCTVLATASDLVSCYTTSRPLNSRANWAHAQARVWADPALRLEAARALYKSQLPGVDLPDNVPLKVLRGLEGRIVRNAYAEGAKKARLTGWRRETNADKINDPVNPLLNLGNSILYAVALSACSTLGLSPALGIIHSGSVSAFLYDLADLHKMRATIPLAFAAARTNSPEYQFRTTLRNYLLDNRVFDDTLTVIDTIFGAHAARSDDQLLDDTGYTPGHTNHHQD